MKKKKRELKEDKVKPCSYSLHTPPQKTRQLRSCLQRSLLQHTVGHRLTTERHIRVACVCMLEGGGLGEKERARPRLRTDMCSVK